MTRQSSYYMRERDNQTKKDLMDSFEGFLERIEEPKRSILRSIIVDYCQYCAWTEECKRLINKEGFIIDGKENPVIGIMHKMSSRKADYYAKITRALKDELSEEEANALESFLDA